jgi:putative ABC transport system ATP-binding protein
MGIVLEGIRKIYNQGTKNENEILKSISFEIDKGKMIAIRGKSGAGKSTLLHIIGCMDKTTKGKYILDNIDITNYSNKEAAKLRNQKFGYIMQDFGLINEDTVYMNVALPLLLGNCKMKDIKKIVENGLKEIEIEFLKDRLVEGLSGGEKQRVAIARALVNDPPYILADEPTGSLDSENAKHIMDLLNKLHKKGKTVIIITHDDDVANQCQESIQIVDGRVV